VISQAIKSGADLQVELMIMFHEAKHVQVHSHLCSDVDADDIVDVDENETEIHQYRAPCPHVEEFYDGHVIFNDADVIKYPEYDIDEKYTGAVEHRCVCEHNDSNRLNCPEQEGDASQNNQFRACQRTSGIQQHRKRNRKEQ